MTEHAEAAFADPGERAAFPWCYTADEAEDGAAEPRWGWCYERQVDHCAGASGCTACGARSWAGRAEQRCVWCERAHQCAPSAADRHEECEEWAAAGECRRNSEAMARACACACRQPQVLARAAGALAGRHRVGATKPLTTRRAKAKAISTRTRFLEEASPQPREDERRER